MPFEVVADEIRRIVLVTVRGSYDAAEVFEMVRRAREVAATRGWNILYDMSAAVPGDMGSGELFWIARRHPAVNVPGAASTRVAVVYPPAHKQLADFWETTFRNAGVRARAFESQPEALGWLRGA